MHSARTWNSNNWSLTAVTRGFTPGGDLRRLSAVPVDLSVEIGRTRMTVGETLELREGSVITLDRMAGEPVDLLVNGTPIARGEVVVIDQQFGLRLTEVMADGRGRPADDGRIRTAGGEPDVRTARQRQIVVFTLGGEHYGLPIHEVHEIIRYAEPRRSRRAPTGCAA